MLLGCELRVKYFWFLFVYERARQKLTIIWSKFLLNLDKEYGKGEGESTYPAQRKEEGCV